MDLKEAISKALIETLLFFEFSDEDIIHPDISIAQIEQVAAILKEMDENGKMEFIKTCSEMAMEYSGEKYNFIISIGENLGLI